MHPKGKNSHDMVNPRDTSGSGTKVGNKGSSVKVNTRHGVSAKVTRRAQRGRK